MPHPRRPGGFQDGGELAWIVWAVLSLFDSDEQTVRRNSTALPVTTPATNLTNSTVPFTTLARNLTNSTLPLPANATVPVAFWPQHSTFPPTSLPCVPITSPFAPFWDLFQNILVTIIVSWLIPFVIGFFVDVVFVFFEPTRTPTPPPTDSDRPQLLQAQNELRNQRDAAQTQLTDVRQQLLSQQSFGEEQRSRAEERGRALAASNERAQELSKANAKLSDVTKSASDNARASKMRLREKVARHDTMATALAKELQRRGQLEKAATTHQGQARKWRQKAEEAEDKIAELQSQLDVMAMQPSEVPDTFQSSASLKEQLAEAVAARDSAAEELAAAEEQVKQLQQSQADLQDQLDKSLVAKAETEAKADALDTDKQAAEATAQSLQGRVQELEKSTSLGEKAAEEEKSQLVVAKETAERQRAAASRELELAVAARKTERKELEREKEAALQKAAEEKRALESAKESTDNELKAVKQELSEANQKIAELDAYKQAQEALFASVSVTLAKVGTEGTEGQTPGTEGQAQGTEEQAQGDDNVQGQGQSWGEGVGDLFHDEPPPSSYDPFGANDEPVPANEDDGSFDPDALNGLFDPASLNDEPLPPDFLSSFQGAGSDAPVGPPQAQDGFNFAEAPAPFQQGESELEKILREYNAAHPASEQPAGATFPSSDFTFTSPPTVPTSTVPQQQQGQPQQGGPSFPSSSFTFTPPSTVPPSTVPQQAVEPQQGGPSLPAFSFTFNPPSTVPTPTVAEQQGQPPQGGPIFGGINSDSAPSSTPFSADLSFFSTNAHPSTIFTGQAPPRAAGPSQDYHREITDADWAEGFAEFQQQQQASGSGNAANPPGGAEHDAGSENKPENETGDGGDGGDEGDGSSTESEEL